MPPVAHWSSVESVFQVTHVAPSALNNQLYRGLNAAQGAFSQNQFMVWNNKKKTVRLIEVVLHILDSAGLGCVYVWYRSAQSFSLTPHFHASHVNQTGGTLNSHP